MTDIEKQIAESILELKKESTKDDRLKRLCDCLEDLAKVIKEETNV